MNKYDISNTISTNNRFSSKRRGKEMHILININEFPLNESPPDFEIDTFKTQRNCRRPQFALFSPELPF